MKPSSVGKVIPLGERDIMLDGNALYQLVLGTWSCVVMNCTSYAMLYCIVLHLNLYAYCYVMYCIVLECIVLECNVLYCIVLYCIVLYCI